MSGEWHDPHNCPNRKMFEALQRDFDKFTDKYHELDKQNAVDSAVLQSQYKTIIDMLTAQGGATTDLAERVGKLEGNFKLSDYKTNQAATFIDRVTWGAVAKLGVLVTLIGIVISTVINFKK